MTALRHVALTGASSGLGAALALAYAAPGVRLSLCARHAERLADVAREAQLRGAEIFCHCADVTNASAMEAWITQIDDACPIDLLIANAGISAGTGGGGETAAQQRAIFDTNVGGVVNTIGPALPRMKARGRGQVALIASLAGFRGLAGSPAYCASKAAVRLLGEGLRGAWAAHGIAVNVVCPGYIKTPMTDVNRFPMPFLMDAPRAARTIQRGLAANKARIAFPWRLYAVVWLLAVLPHGWTDGLLARLPRKPAQAPSS